MEVDPSDIINNIMSTIQSSPPVQVVSTKGVDDIISTLQSVASESKPIEEPPLAPLPLVYTWFNENEECAMVEPSEHYTMVTSTVAIGNSSSSYEPFDVVVDLSFHPQHQLNPLEIRKEQQGPMLIYRIGLLDHPDEPIDQVFSSIVPDLLQRTKEQPDVKILFHCQMGRSRSASMAIAYLSMLLHQSYSVVLHNIQSRRPIVQPNDGFCRAIQVYLATHSLELSL